jgi:hypothetical protein
LRPSAQQFVLRFWETELKKPQSGNASIAVVSLMTMLVLTVGGVAIIVNTII